MLRFILLVLLIFFIGFSSWAQDQRKLSIALHTGFAQQIEENPLNNLQGLHLGANASRTVSQIFTWEGQLSVNFVSGYETILAPSLLVGGRLYFNKSNNNNRYYFNALGGITYQYGSGDDYIESLILPGFSGGFHAEFDKLIVGLSIEQPIVWVLKVGWKIR